MNTYVTVNTQQAKLICAILLEVGLAFEVTTGLHMHGERMFRVQTDVKHKMSLGAIHASVLRQTSKQ